MESVTPTLAPDLTTRSDATSAPTELRVRRRRAWLPTHLTTGGWLWFGCPYEVVESFEPDHGGWTTGHWVEIEAHAIR